MDGRVSRGGAGAIRPSLAGGVGVVVVDGREGVATALDGREVSTVDAGAWIGPGAEAGAATPAESADSRLDDPLQPTVANTATPPQNADALRAKKFRFTGAS